MREILKMMFIPIVGCIAIGTLFLFVIFGGRWEHTIINQDGLYGHAAVDLDIPEGYIGPTTDCDPHLYAPVCALDGETYDNACFAYRAGSPVTHHGACQN